MVPAGMGASDAARDQIVDAVAEDLRRAASEAQPAEFGVREVGISCPNGKHRRSLLTFIGHTRACLFCVPCEDAWTEPNTHRALAAK